MGHIRLGRLPATKKWKQVVAFLRTARRPNREPERAPKLRRTRWNTRGVIPLSFSPSGFQHRFRLQPGRQIFRTVCSDSD